MEGIKTLDSSILYNLRLMFERAPLMEGISFNYELRDVHYPVSYFQFPVSSLLPAPLMEGIKTLRRFVIADLVEYLLINMKGRN